MWMAPAKRSSFSVRVVFPASGWEMMAKVRRRAVSCAISDSVVIPRILPVLALPLRHQRLELVEVLVEIRCGRARYALLGVRPRPPHPFHGALPVLRGRPVGDVRLHDRGREV